MVDLNDFIHRETSRHGKPVKLKLYRHTCNNCGADRGYQAKSFHTPSCNKCAKVGTYKSDITRLLMSQAAVKRYNDPTWMPKSKPTPFEGCRRPKSSYIAKTTAIQRKIRHNTKTLLWQKLMNRSLNKSGSTTFDLLGYTVDELMKHLESQFKDGMSWDNYEIGGWEIDHKVPDSWFVYSSVGDQGFKDSWSLENLQPMWYDENRSKGARYAGRS